MIRTILDWATLAFVGGLASNQYRLWQRKPSRPAPPANVEAEHLMDREFARRYRGLWLAAAMLGMNSGGFLGYLITGGNVLWPIWFSIWMVVWLGIAREEARKLDDS